MISEGHDFEQIKRYSLSQLMLFVELMNARYKRMNAASESDDKNTHGSMHDAIRKGVKKLPKKKRGRKR